MTDEKSGSPGAGYCGTDVYDKARHTIQIRLDGLRFTLSSKDALEMAKDLYERVPHTVFHKTSAVGQTTLGDIPAVELRGLFGPAVAHPDLDQLGADLLGLERKIDSLVRATQPPATPEEVAISRGGRVLALQHRIEIAVRRLNRIEGWIADERAAAQDPPPIGMIRAELGPGGGSDGNGGTK